MVATCVLAATIRPADADDTSAPPSPPSAEQTSPSAPAERHLGTEGKVLIYTFGGIALVSSIVLGVSVIGHESAVSRHDSFPVKEGFVDCTTPQQCSDVANARRDADAWHDRMVVAGGIATATAISTAVFVLFWPRVSSKAQVTPSVSTAGASIGLQGQF
ncbi:hypothetical protein BH11MYX4_BH11MYX4_02360 [soil metagenome]